MSFLKTICFFFRLFLDKLIDFIFSLYWDDKKVPIPDLSKEHALLSESAVTLAKKIKNKELKSEDLVKVTIERIKQVNPILNAVIAERYEAALEEAREIDRQIEAGLSEEMAKKPFLGVPFTAKESQAMKDMPLTLGLWSRRNEIADEDSAGIIMMKEAGAIPLALSNLPELLIWQETRNTLHGMTKNPQHTGRSAGGSSGAEAALTAAYATPISLCSDVGGSTRMPAFYCGMFGHHPTAGMTDTKGILFRKQHTEDTMFCLGFISKHATDLGPLTKIISGKWADKLKLEEDRDLKKVKFYYLESSGDPLVSPIRPEMKNTLNRVLKNVKDNLKAEVQPYKHEGFNYMYRLWSYWMNKEPENYFTIASNSNSEPDGIVELIKKAFGMSKYCLFLIMRFIELKYLPLPESKWADRITKDLKDDLLTKLGDNGVLLLPSSPHAAPYHYSAFLRPFNFSYFAIVNVLKCPATQVPIGTNSIGLPLGIQVVASPYNDALCLTVAKYLEKEFGGAVMPCKVQK